jgi:hypothetical protein
MKKDKEILRECEEIIKRRQVDLERIENPHRQRRPFLNRLLLIAAVPLFVLTLPSSHHHYTSGVQNTFETPTPTVSPRLIRSTSEPNQGFIRVPRVTSWTITPRIVD